MRIGVSEIRDEFAGAFKALDGARAVPEIDVRFYPYVGINHTIRARDGKIFVRIAEVCSDAPREAFRSLALILVAKLLKKRIPRGAAAEYREYASSDEVRRRATENRKARGRKKIISARGEHYNLDVIFERLNLIYFGNKIPKPRLSWSASKTYRILGHHDATHETIIVSLSLDDRNVPEYVVESVVYHEMLHIVHPVRRVNGRRRIHTPEFRRDERKFAFYDEAEEWIRKHAGTLKRRAAT